VPPRSATFVDIALTRRTRLARGGDCRAVMLGLEINDSLSAGEIIVGVGTLALAGFTWHLASDTNALDERNAARERKRRERQVRGIARLVNGELSIIDSSLKTRP